MNKMTQTGIPSKNWSIELSYVGTTYQNVRIEFIDFSIWTDQLWNENQIRSSNSTFILSTLQMGSVNEMKHETQLCFWWLCLMKPNSWDVWISTTTVLFNPLDCYTIEKLASKTNFILPINYNFSLLESIKIFFSVEEHRNLSDSDSISRQALVQILLKERVFDLNKSNSKSKNNSIYNLE